MANLSLRDDFQSRDHVSRHYPDITRGQTNELTCDHLKMRIPKHTTWMILILRNEREP